MTVPNRPWARLQQIVGLRPFSPSRLTTVLFGAHVALKLALLPIALRTPLRGDELTYATGAKTMAASLRSLLSGHPAALSALQDNVVGNGWFMPGMSSLLTPLYLVAPDAGTSAVRVYAGIVTLMLFAGAVVALYRVAPWPLVAVLTVVPGLVPLWALYSYTIWGDLSAGIMLILLLAFLTRLWMHLDADDPLRMRDAAMVGILLGTTLYLRSSTLPLVIGILAMCGLAVICQARGRQLVRGLVACGLAALLVITMISPWSYAASRTFDSRVTTTTTLPLSLAYAFGDQQELCFGPCPRGNIWYAMVTYSRRVAELTGESELTVQQRMSDYALRNVTPSTYSGDVLDNFGRYALQPTGYAAMFRTVQDGAAQEDAQVLPPSFVSRLTVVSTNLLYFATLLLAAVGVLYVRRTPSRTQVVGLLASLIAAALMMQPFVHVSSARYWPVFLPMLALVAACLLVRRDDEVSSVVLRRLQIGIAALWVAVPTTLIFLSRLPT